MKDTDYISRKRLYDDRKRKRSGKPNTKRACYHCKKSHSCCSNEKPCPRCIQRGLQCISEEEYEEMKNKGLTTNNGSLMEPQLIGNTVGMKAINDLGPDAKESMKQIMGMSSGVNQHLHAASYKTNISDPRPKQKRKFMDTTSFSNYLKQDIPDSLHANAESQSASIIPNFYGNSQLIKQLTDVMTQQKEVIHHLLHSKTHHDFSNPFAEFYATTTPVSMWKFTGIGRPRELLGCNNAFAQMMNCNSFRDLLAQKYHHEGIHVVLANCNVDPTNTPVSELLTLSQGIAIILHGILTHIQQQPTFDLLDRIRFMTNKSRIYGRVLFNRILFQEGIMYMSHHTVEKWDNGASINEFTFPPTSGELEEGYGAKDQEAVYETYYNFLMTMEKAMKKIKDKEMKKAAELKSNPTNEDSEAIA